MPRRLVPHEHTGLLPRAEREAVERSFIDGRHSWDVNILSATPTLEMGIDIGELSSVLLCSVPPAQANYLQRIGRAGRLDGNALAVTIANGQNHDLFFYADPLEMIAGNVHTPGVFLQATAVLERQLVAYCFDRWTAQGSDAGAIPTRLREVMNAVQKPADTAFPYTFISFVESNRHALLSAFLGLFDRLDEEARQWLQECLEPVGERSISLRLIDRLQQLVSEREGLVRTVKQLRKQLDKLRKLPADESTGELIKQVERERGALLSLLQGRDSQPVLNFFTDEGLLPNYAFPEEGVSLQSVILRRLDQGEVGKGGSSYDKVSYLFQRSAQAALAELAPESRFYALSYEMEIDQIDLQLSRSEDWRFCDRCHHSERVDTGDVHSACPRCGSAQWADAGQRHAVLKLRQVYSTVDARRGRIGDDSEQREPRFFNRQMLVDIPTDGHLGGFRLDSEELPFGFELLRRVNFREVNFGESSGESNRFHVAGRELSRRGFRICRHCGKVQKEYPRRNEPMHAYSCKLRDASVQPAAEDFFDSLYLYRSLQSEAIRILLPLSEVAYSDQNRHSFIAALNLGLRKYFRGNVQHLELTEMADPPGNDSGERLYLVVYDRIPGGTGYLKELMREPDNMMQVLSLAAGQLASCACIDDDELDGCYRCIFAYRDSRNMANISRSGALRLLDDILKLRDRLVPVESLGGISTNTLIESALEQRFVDALKRLPNVRASARLVRGKPGTWLTLPGRDGKPVSWQLEHQVSVGPADGVALQTKIDMVLRPTRASDAHLRPIAIYTDGLQFHHDIVHDDVAKRTALQRSGKYWVFSLNWDDLPELGRGMPAAPEGDLMARPGEDQLRTGTLYDQLATGWKWLSTAEHQALHGHGTLALLDLLLRDPRHGEGLLRQRALWRSFTALAPARVGDTAWRAALARDLAALLHPPVDESLGLTDAGGLVGALHDGESRHGLGLAATLPLAVMKTVSANRADADALCGAIRVHLHFDDAQTDALDDGFKRRWRIFWHAANQLQFLPGFSMATTRAVQSGELERIWRDAASVRDSLDGPGDDHDGAHGWAQALEHCMLSPAQQQALLELAGHLPMPSVGADLLVNGVVVVGGEQAELSWPKARVAVITGDTAPIVDGWTMILADDDMAAQLRKLLAQGVFA